MTGKTESEAHTELWDVLAVIWAGTVVPSRTTMEESHDLGEVVISWEENAVTEV